MGVVERRARRLLGGVGAIRLAGGEQQGYRRKKKRLDFHFPERFFVENAFSEILQISTIKKRRRAKGRRRREYYEKLTTCVCGRQPLPAR